MKHFLKHLISFISQIVEYYELHPVRLMKVLAAQESVEYISKKMPQALSFYHDDAILQYALKMATLPGCFLEFGVYKGRSIRRIAKQVGLQQKVHGFDSFEGLPEDWGGTTLKEAAFSVKGRLPQVPPNVMLHKGWFNDTLPLWLKDHRETVSFLHVDCDLYSSTKTIFDGLGDYIRPGTIILFDEYLNFPGWREHEYKAFQEFVDRRKVSYEYLGYSWVQVAVKITGIE